MPDTPFPGTVAVIANGWRTMSESAGTESQVTDAVLFTVCTNGADVLPAVFASPLYTVVKESLPVGKVSMVNCANPLATAADPTEAAPLKNCTVPVAAAGVTAARSTIGCVNSDGVVLVVNVVVDEVLLTVCVTALEVLVR